MAGSLKYWRESATLILASKRMPPFQPTQSTLNRILRKAPESPVMDLEESLRILMMKRSSKSSFMPDNYVFPGGMLDEVDFSKEWMHHCLPQNETNHFFVKGNAGSPIFSRQREPEFSMIPAEVALRVAAIRETFEESGILIARPVSEVKSNNLSCSESHPLGCSVHHINDDKIMTDWRGKITGDSSQFLKMCQEFEVVPDVWSLYEWSNWMTPVHLRSSRFDTAFFVGCVEEAPQISVNSGEMETGLWSTPSSLLKASLGKAITLGPPQLYELSRLIRFGSVDDLLTFAWKRSDQRVDRLMPVICKCADGLLFLMPGDDLYPDDPDFTGETYKTIQQRPETFAELQEQFPYQHRGYISDADQILSFHCNLYFTDAHILPLPTAELDFLKDGLS